MTFGVPVSYRLDAEGTVAHQIQEDTFSFLLDVERQFAEQRIARLTHRAAHYCVGGDESRESIFRRMAVSASGAAACASFMESDLSPLLMSRTFSHASSGSLQAHLYNGSQEECLDTLTQIASAGHIVHPEFRHTTDMLMEYFCEATQNPEVGKLAYCGAGFMLRQFDVSWEKVRAQAINDICMEETQSIDWDSLLK